MNAQWEGQQYFKGEDAWKFIAALFAATAVTE